MTKESVQHCDNCGIELHEGDVFVRLTVKRIAEVDEYGYTTELVGGGILGGIVCLSCVGSI